MADDLSDVTLLFHNNSLKSRHKHGADSCVYLGEALKYDVLVRKPTGKDTKGWKRRVAKLSACAQILPVTLKKKSKRQDGESGEDKLDTVVCPVVATYIDSVDRKHSTSDSSQVNIDRFISHTLPCYRLVDLISHRGMVLYFFFVISTNK